MSTINNQLGKLNTELKEYDFIVKKLSDVNLSELEINNFINQNKDKIKEMNKIRKKISQLEWQLMTPNQQKDYLEKYSED